MVRLVKSLGRAWNDFDRQDVLAELPFFADVYRVFGMLSLGDVYLSLLPGSP